MAYQTFSNQAPDNLTGITAALVKVVQHNPKHPNTAVSNYPAEYPKFVSPTNDQMSSILVEDEVHPLADVDTGNQNRCFLHHQPVFGATISVSSGTVNSALTDYEHGIIYFSALPTGQFTVQYQANPDKYYGEFLQAIQDVIHSIVWLLGAGQTLNEGIRNAEVYVDSLPANLQARLPNAIRMNGIPKDIWIRSSTDPVAPGGTKHTITLGNGEDTVVVDAKHLLTKRSISGSAMNMRFGDETGDFASFGGGVDITGTVVMGVRGTSKNPTISSSAVQAFELTGAPYVSGTYELAVHGDAVVHGDLWVLGTTTTLNVTRNIQVNVFEEDLEVGNNIFVKGSTRFGASTSQKTQFGGTVEITGGLDVYGAGAAPIRIDTPIIFTNGALKGSFQQTTIDGLDPSYIECVRKYMRSDYRHGWPIDGMRTPLFEGTITYLTGLDLIADTGVPNSITTAFPTGTYYAGKFDHGDFTLIIKTGTNKGERIPIRAFDQSSGQWTLTRELDNAYAVGDQFAVYSERNSLPNFVQAGVGLSVRIQASSVWPLVGWQKGVIKKRGSNYDILSLPANSTVYIFMTVKNGVNGMDEDEPTFFYSLSNVESDESILLAVAVTGPSSVTSVTCYSINAAYDTLWTKFDTAASGNTLAIGADWTISARMGNQKRASLNTDRVEIFVAPDTAGAPDLTSIKRVDLHSAGFYIKTVGMSSLTVATPTAGYLSLSAPYWVRVVLP